MAKVQVYTKGHKHFGKVYPPQPTEYEIDQDGKKITIWMHGKECRSFSIGDIAEYDSYNLSYMGVIKTITSKCVTITAYKGSRMEKDHRLDLNKFCWRNHNFDQAKAAAQNIETSYSI